MSPEARAVVEEYLWNHHVGGGTVTSVGTRSQARWFLEYGREDAGVPVGWPTLRYYIRHSTGKKKKKKKKKGNSSFLILNPIPGTALE